MDTVRKIESRLFNRLRKQGITPTERVAGQLQEVCHNADEMAVADYLDELVILRKNLLKTLNLV